MLGFGCTGFWVFRVLGLRGFRGLEFEGFPRFLDLRGLGSRVFRVLGLGSLGV